MIGTKTETERQIEDLKIQVDNLRMRVSDLEDKILCMHRDRPNPKDVNPYKPRKKY